VSKLDFSARPNAWVIGCIVAALACSYVFLWRGRPPLPSPLHQASGTPAPPPPTTAAAGPTATSHAAVPAPNPPVEPLPDLTAAVDRLLAAVAPSAPANADFPPFARHQLQWVFTEARSGRLTIVLLEDLANSKLHANTLMASGEGVLGGSRSIVVAQPGFRRLLRAGLRQQRNDFMLGLVHEALHLQSPTFAAPSTKAPIERLAEETRVWRTVDIEVVRPLRRRGEPMDPTFLRVDDALLACRDRLPCQALSPDQIPEG
jgi:hypothetical protein